MSKIPSDINGWDKSRIAEYYIDELNWTLTPLKSRSKNPLFTKDKQYDFDRVELLAHLGNGANFGLFPAGTHVVLDLDSKKDGGKSTERFLAQSGPKVQSLPRERTAGGVHIHLRISDLEDVIRKYPSARKLVNPKVSSKVSGELFFGAKNYVVTSPSVHELGEVYQWEVFGDIPTWTWREFVTAFGEFVPDKSKQVNEEVRARRWSGDLKTLNIIALTQELGWYIGPDDKRPEMHHVFCPWASDHSDEKVVAAVFEGTGDNWPGFNCFHDHCAKHGIIDFLDYAETCAPGIVDKHCTTKWKFEGVGSKDKRGRPQIPLPGAGREKDDFVDDVGEALEDKEFWFMHGPDIVRVDEQINLRMTPDGEVEACERVLLKEVTATVAESTLGTYIATGYINIVEMEDGRKERVFVNESIPAPASKMLVGSPRLQEKLPKIDRILDIPIPILTGKNTWRLPKKGYNPELRTLVDQDLKLREMPLKDALDILADIVADFPFADDDDGQSRCHWYARLITPMCRGIMGWDARMPCWVFMANRPGAGKDYLNGVAQILYYGYAFEDPAIASRNSEETEKRITSAHAAARRSMHIANQQEFLQDQAFIAAITNTVHRSRRLGSNDATASVEYQNELEFSMSANIGLQWREDFTRRARFIKLAYFEEDANSRKFKYPDLHNHVRQDRERILSAVYSLLMEWKRQGCPSGDVYSAFSRLSEVVGGILPVCGLGNPCLPTNWGGMDVGGDPLADAMRAVFSAGHERHGNDWIGAESARALVSGPTSVSERWGGLEDPKEKEQFGRDLKIYNRRELNRITLEWKEPTKKLNRTKVRFLKKLEDSNVGTSFGEGPEAKKTDTRTSDSNIGTSTTKTTPKTVPVAPVCPGRVPPAYREKEKNKKNLEESLIYSDPRTGSNRGYRDTPFEYVTDSLALRKAVALLTSEPKESPLALDIETYGPPPEMKGRKKVRDPLGSVALDPLRGSIRLLSLKSEDSLVYVIDLDKVVFPAALKELLENRKLVGHNLWFDLAFLKVRFQVNSQDLFDTMTAAQILANGLSQVRGQDGLGPVISKYLGIEILKDQGTSDWSAPELSADQLRYSATDVHHLLSLKMELERVLEQEGLTYTMELENDLIPAVIDLYLRGIAVDREMLHAMRADAELAKQAAEQRVKDALDDQDLNVNSNAQLLNAFAKIGLRWTSTNKEVTADNQDHPAVAALIEYRKIKSGYTEKMESLMEVIRPDGRIHSRYKPLGADTGRFSCTKPNLQQVPAMDKAPIRKVFRPSEGRVLIKLDYNQMELRAIASYIDEKVMLEAYRKGEDLHRKMASGIFGVAPEEITKDQRGRGKTTNFGFSFGQRENGFIAKAKEEDGLDISIAEATHYRDVFFKTYPGTKAWHKGIWDKISRSVISEVRTLIGRRRLIPKGTKDWHIFTNLVNMPIQGGCADALKLSIIELYEILPEGTFLVGTVHDELIIETDIQIAQDILKLAKGVMEKWASELFS